MRYLNKLKPNILTTYLLSEFFSVLFLCLLASTGLFLVFDTFERIKVFISYKTPFLTALSYLALKVPLILQLMIPIATLISCIISLGRLSQKSEITAMRAGGLSVLRIARPLIGASFLLTIIMFLNGEFIVPQATEKVENIFQFDIKQKHLSGKLNRNNFWYREKNTFINVGFFDTVKKNIEGITVLEFNEDFRLIRRIDARSAFWIEGVFSGWILENAIESSGDMTKGNKLYSYARLPLITKKTPKDLYNLQRSSETFSYPELKKYIRKLQSEGVITRKYEVDLVSKISFPLVCVVASMIAIPFSFTSVRSGSLTLGFIAAVSIGFGYYIIHAFFCSFGASGFLPVHLAAWSANILLCAVGIYFLGGAEFRK